ncbi:MAG: hypothetical protein RLY70_1710 [Planctomycetota bacterium]
MANNPNGETAIAELDGRLAGGLTAGRYHTVVSKWKPRVTEAKQMAKLQVGDRAPDFEATTHQGTRIRLADFVGHRGLVLFFYPKDDTPICTKEACSFRDSYNDFVAAGVEVIGVSSDSSASHQAFAARHQLNFPLIADANGELRKRFGVPSTLGLFPGRVTYVIDKHGIVRLVFSAQLASDEHVRKALEAIRSNGRES